MECGGWVGGESRRRRRTSYQIIFVLILHYLPLLISLYSISFRAHSTCPELTIFFNSMERHSTWKETISALFPFHLSTHYLIIVIDCLRLKFCCSPPHPLEAIHPSLFYLSRCLHNHLHSSISIQFVLVWMTIISR